MAYGHKDWCNHPGSSCTCEQTLDKILKEIRERADAATEGPWNPIDEQRDIEVFHHVVKRMRNDNGWTYVAGETGLKDTLFISHARTDVPMLLEMVKELLPKECWCDSELMIQCDDCTIRSKIRKIAEKYK